MYSQNTHISGKVAFKLTLNEIRSEVFAMHVRCFQPCNCFRDQFIYCTTVLWSLKKSSLTYASIQCNKQNEEGAGTMKNSFN